MRVFHLALLPVIAWPAALPSEPEAAPSETMPANGTVSGSVVVLDGAQPVHVPTWVYLKPVTPRKLRQLDATIAQKKYEFDPDIVVIPVGSRVWFPNNEPLNSVNNVHNVFSPAFFDQGHYGPPRTSFKEFPSADDYRIYCDVHPRMIATVGVIDSDLFARASGDRFTITGVPDGTYKVIGWAEDWDPTSATQDLVTVDHGAATTAPHPVKVHLKTKRPPKVHNRLSGQPYDPKCLQYPTSIHCKTPSGPPSSKSVLQSSLKP